MLTFEEVNDKFPGQWERVLDTVFYIFFYPDEYNNKPRLRYDSQGFHFFSSHGNSSLVEEEINALIKKQSALYDLRNFQ